MKKLPRIKKATARQIKFVEEYARNGMDVKKAYKAAFTTQNDDVAYTEGNRLLRLPWVEKELHKHKTTLERRAARLGMDDESLLKEHKKLIYATKKIYNKDGELMDEIPDYPAIAKGLEMIYKLLGKNAAERHAFEGIGGKPLIPETDLSGLTKEELLKKRDEILKIAQGIQ